MACPIIIRRHEGVQSYLVLDDNPRELLRHVGFTEPVFRAALAGLPWTPRTPGRNGPKCWRRTRTTIMITDADHRDYCLERSDWDHCKMWPPRP